MGARRFFAKETDHESTPSRGGSRRRRGGGWAPIIDEYDPPLVGAWLGRRRGWMLTAQLGVAAGLSGLAFGAPAESLGWSFAFAFLTAFAAASQDVTIDGWHLNHGRATAHRREQRPSHCVLSDFRDARGPGLVGYDLPQPLVPRPQRMRFALEQIGSFVMARQRLRVSLAPDS